MRLRNLAALMVLLLAGCAAPRTVTPTAPEQPRFTEEGIASWYGKQHSGHRTANGERFDAGALTAAHRSLPFDTIVRVTSLDSGRTVKVRINDRGPYARGRIIDLSARAARLPGIAEDGVARVRLAVFAADQAASSGATEAAGAGD
jgi:rare lipoprotein A